MSYFIPWHSCLKFLETKAWKKPHYLIGQLLQISPCNLIWQHAIFHKARWMLTSDPLFEFPLLHEVIFHGLFETILHGFWSKIVFNYSNLSPSCKDMIFSMIFSKLFYAKARKNLNNHAILPESLLKIQLGNC